MDCLWFNTNQLQLDALSRDDLIKLVKKQLISMRDTKQQLEEAKKVFSVNVTDKYLFSP
jgi:ribosomal protein L19E